MELCKTEFKRTHTFLRHTAVTVLETANMSLHEIMFSVSINNKFFLSTMLEESLNSFLSLSYEEAIKKYTVKEKVLPHVSGN